METGEDNKCFRLKDKINLLLVEQKSTLCFPVLNQKQPESKPVSTVDGALNLTQLVAKKKLDCM